MHEREGEAVFEMSSSAIRFSIVRSAVAVEFVLEMRMMTAIGCGTIDPIHLDERDRQDRLE